MVSMQGRHPFPTAHTLPMTATPQEPRPIRAKWKGTLTDRERFFRQMHFEPVDRCFNMEFGYWKENFTKWRLFRDNGITNNPAADRFFNFDRVEGVGGKIWLNPGFEHKIVGETDTYWIVQNADGLLGEEPKDGHSTIPHFTKASITCPEEWERVKAERFRIDDPERIVDVAEIQRQHPEDRDYVLTVWCGSMIGKVRDLLTMEGLAYMCADEPEMVEDMVETCCRMVEHFLDQVLGKVTFDAASGWDDICCNSGPLVSPAFFRDVVAPRYRRISDRLVAHGVDIFWVDTDGDVRHLLPHYLAAGVNTMFPWEVNGSGHPRDAMAAYPGELRIMGGVNKMKLVEGREATRAWLESLEATVRGGGFIPFCDHRCPPDVSEETYLYYLDLKETFFGMA